MFYQPTCLSSGIIVFRFLGPILFANKERFTDQLVKVLRFDPATISKTQAKLQKLKQKSIEVEQNIRKNSVVKLPNGEKIKGRVCSAIGVVSHSINTIDEHNNLAFDHDEPQSRRSSCDQLGDIELSEIQHSSVMFRDFPKQRNSTATDYEPSLIAASSVIVEFFKVTSLNFESGPDFKNIFLEQTT